jgi:hypothetical protein
LLNHTFAQWSDEFDLPRVPPSRSSHRWGASDEKLNHTGEEGRHRIGDRGVLRGIHIRSRERRGAGRSTGLQNDALTVCSQFIPDRDRVASCLISNRSHISPACRMALTQFNPKMASTAKSAARH